jgi:erythromycin esterase
MGIHGNYKIFKESAYTNVVITIDEIGPSAVKNAIEAYNCFEPYGKDVENYAHATIFVPENCEDEVIEMLTSLRRKIDDYSKRSWK